MALDDHKFRSVSRRPSSLRIALVVITGAVLGGFLTGCSEASTSAQTTATPATTNTPAAHLALGDTARIADAWQMQITAFRVTGPGDTPAVQIATMTMTLKNTGSVAARFDDAFLLTVRDDAGQRHGIGEQTDICRLSTGASQCLDALTLDPGAQQIGDLSAVIPAGRTHFTLTVTATTGAGIGALAIWNLQLSQ
jgi:hypothetical protein